MSGAHFHPRSFASFLPFDLLELVTTLFFDILHPIVPYPNEVIFQSDIARRRDLGPDQQEWTAMVISLIGFTIVQIPNLVEGMTKSSLRELAQNCSEYTRDHLSIPCRQASIDRCRFSMFWYTVCHAHKAGMSFYL